MGISNYELTEDEQKIDTLVAIVEAKTARESYLNKLEELSDIEDDIKSIQEDIENKNDRINGYRKSIEEENKGMSSAVEKRKNEIIGERIKQETKVLYATKYKITDEISKSKKMLDKELKELKKDFDASKKGRDAKKEEEIQKSIATIKRASIDILGERLSRLIDNHLDRNRIELSYTDIDSINERLQHLHSEAVSLDVSAAADVDGFMKGLTRKLNFNVKGKILLLYIGIFAVACYFLYQYILPLLFLALLFISYLFITNTSRLYSIRLESKAIEDNLEEVLKARDIEAEQQFNIDKEDLERYYGDIISDYESHIRQVDSDIRDTASNVRATEKPDTSSIVNEIQARTTELTKQVDNLTASLGEDNEELLLNRKKRKEIIDSLDSIVNTTWNGYYNWDINDKNKKKTKILPDKIPIAKFKDSEYEETGLEYFTIPRTNALFIYFKKDYIAVLDWAKIFIDGLIANMVPQSLMVDVNERKYNAEMFRDLDKIDKACRTNALPENTFKAMCESNKGMITTRTLDYEKKEKGADQYNWDSAKLDSILLEYKMLLNFDEDSIEENIISATSGESLADVGVYTYNFISYERLLESKYEDILHKLNKYSGTKYSGSEYNTLFMLNSEICKPTGISSVLKKLNTDSAKK